MFASITITKNEIFPKRNFMLVVFYGRRQDTQNDIYIFFVFYRWYFL